AYHREQRQRHPQQGPPPPRRAPGGTAWRARPGASMMNNRIQHELAPSLARHVEALHQPPDATVVEAAQHRLADRLRPADARRGSRSPRGVVAATTAVIALVAVVAIPMRGQGGRAFAAVQRHFTDFDLLSMKVEQRMG